MRILRREAFSDTTFLWEVLAPDVARAAQPGHFVMVRLHEGCERIPLTVADFDRDAGTITIVVQALGKTTREMRDGYGDGDGFARLRRPARTAAARRQGRARRAGRRRARRRADLPAAARLQGGRQPHTGIIGFRNQDLVFWEDSSAQHCDDLIVCTDDGSYGSPGFVTAALKDVLERDDPGPGRGHRPAADDDTPASRRRGPSA